MIPSSARSLRISLPLLAVAAVSASLVVVLRPYVQYEGILDDVSAWGSFFNVFGVIYAIVAGFLLITVLNRYSSLSQTIEDELNAVESIRDFLVYFESSQPDAVLGMKGALGRYIKGVATVEWEEMADQASPTNSDTSEDLYRIMRCAGKIRVQEERDSSILAVVIAGISELAKMRTRRIALSNERLPHRLRLLLFFMSISLVAAFLVVGIHSLYAHVFMTSALSLSVYLLYWIIEDLDHPFYGVWNIDRSPLDELIRRFESDVNVPPPA